MIGGLPPANRPHRSRSEYVYVPVDISLPAIRLFLYGENVDANRTPLTVKLDYRWKIVKDGQFLCKPSSERDNQEEDVPAIVY